MKFCSRCGAKIENESKRFCADCGCSLESQDTNDYSLGRYPQPVNANLYPLKWFKFLIYFGLFAGSFFNLVYGSSYITGNIYSTVSEVSADAVYAFFGNGLKMLDIIYGIVLILVAVFGIFTRMRLAKYRANGPAYLYALYIISATVSLIYNIAVAIITGITTDIHFSWADSLMPIVGTVIILTLNFIYFQKRRELFEN